MRRAIIQLPFTGLWKSLRKLILYSVISICALVCCCGGSTTISTIRALSPDGEWQAIARTVHYGGPGNSTTITTIDLERIKLPRPTKIISLLQNTDSIDLKMNWLTSRHLDVTYGQPVEIGFQAIKCAGLDISLRYVNTEKTNTSK